MTKERDPYSRHYWRLVDDDKFKEVYPDDHHFATWSRLLMLADQAWPASAHLPASARRMSVKKLADVGLIVLLPGGRFRMKGTNAERARRSQLAKDAADIRWGNADRSADGNAERTATADPPGMPSNTTQSNTEQSKATQHRPRASMESVGDVLPRVGSADAYGVSDDEHRVFAYLSRCGAFIRPDAPLGLRLQSLIERRGVESVLEQISRMSKGERLSDRQWVFGLEAALDPVPGSKDAREAEQAVDEQKRRAAREARIAAQHVKEYRATGIWQPHWPPKPAGLDADHAA